MTAESQTAVADVEFTESSVRRKIVVALDLDTAKEALSLVDRLAGRVGMFKVGSQLFSSEGPAVVREIVKRGQRVFLDLKYHDIPNTVAHAAAAAGRLGVSIFNVHTSGGKAMMEATVAAATESAQREGLTRPLILGVTVLTSMDSQSLQTIGVDEGAESHVLRLANLAREAGLDGVVASPLEIRSIRNNLPEGFVILTPGIRPAETKDDQKRTSTPAEAIRAGANYLVIGRPITGAPDPVAALEQIVKDTSTAH